MVGERVEQTVERRLVLARGRQVPGEREMRAPALGLAGDELFTQVHEPVRGPERPIGPLQPIERKMRVAGYGGDQPLPCLDRRGRVALLLVNITEIEVRRDGSRIRFDGARESSSRAR